MKDKKDYKCFYSYVISKDPSTDKNYEMIAEKLRQALIGEGLLSSDMIDRPPQKEAGEDDSAYFHRLRERWGKASQVADTHERWKAKHLNGVQERDLKRRIFIQLQELLKSGFLRNDYIETGMPDEDCENARKWLKREGWADLLNEEDGADWKLALLLRHLLKQQPGHCLLCDAGNVGFYISDMQDRLRWEDVEAFFRFDTYMHLVDEDINSHNNGVESNQLGSSNDLPHQKENAVSDFVNKLCLLADNIYSSWNKKEANLGGQKGSATIVIKRDELKDYLQLQKDNNFDDLANWCYPPKADNKNKLCKYVKQLYEAGYFGKLPKKNVAEILAPIVGLSTGTVQGYL